MRKFVVIAAMIATGCAGADQEARRVYKITFAGDVIWTEEALVQNEEVNAALFCGDGPWRHIQTTREADGRTATITFQCIIPDNTNSKPRN